jgi:hypothetical protein
LVIASSLGGYQAGDAHSTHERLHFIATQGKAFQGAINVHHNPSHSKVVAVEHTDASRSLERIKGRASQAPVTMQ